MYIQGFIVPVKPDMKDEYRQMAGEAGAVFADYGALEIVEAFESDIADGEHTDFRTAVKAEEGEKIVFSWVIWPDKATCDAAAEKMMSDERMQPDGREIPFSMKRIIFGGFEPIFTHGRD